MNEIFIQRFCALCGQTKSLNTPKYTPKKIFVVEENEELDLGFMCPKCYKHLENGGVFTKPKK